MISEFTIAVLEIVKKIPRGKVTTYKQIAELAGKPGASRGVSWILHSCSTKYKLPWHRVINSQGKISFDPTTVHFRKQKKWLEMEGLPFDSAGKLNLHRHQWKPPRISPKQRRPAKKTGRSQPSLFSTAPRFRTPSSR